MSIPEFLKEHSVILVTSVPGTYDRVVDELSGGEYFVVDNSEYSDVVSIIKNDINLLDNYFTTFGNHPIKFLLKSDYGITWRCYEILGTSYTPPDKDDFWWL